jgi:hypothetical protein
MYLLFISVLCVFGECILKSLNIFIWCFFLIFFCQFNHVHYSSIITNQIKKNWGLLFYIIPFFNGNFKGLYPFVYRILKITSIFKLLLFALYVKLNSKIMKIFLHIPWDVFCSYFLDIFYSKKIKRKYLLGGFWIFFLGFELFEEPFIRVDLVIIFMIFQRRLSNSQKLSSRREDTWVIYSFTFI